MDVVSNWVARLRVWYEIGRIVRNVRTVRFCTVWERDVFGGEAALLSECWICHIYVDADVPVPIS